MKKLVREKLNEGFSEIPLSNKKKGKETDAEMLRAAIVAEYDAINLYLQMANNTTDKKLQKVLRDIAKEEKTHIGEFQALLLNIDKEQEEELKVGKKEIKSI